MKHTNRKLFMTLGLVASLALPGLAMADNWRQPSLKYSVQQHQAQRHDARRGHAQDRYREHEFAYRDRDDRHEWREHHRERRYDRDNYYRRHEWREHAHRYYRLHRYYGYGIFPSAFVSGVYVAPTPRLIIDLR